MTKYLMSDTIFHYELIQYFIIMDLCNSDREYTFIYYNSFLVNEKGDLTLENVVYYLINS